MVVVQRVAAVGMVAAGLEKEVSAETGTKVGACQQV